MLACVRHLLDDTAALSEIRLKTFILVVTKHWMNARTGQLLEDDANATVVRSPRLLSTSVRNNLAGIEKRDESPVLTIVGKISHESITGVRYLCCDGFTQLREQYHFAPI
jgi:hypothetical protein